MPTFRSCNRFVLHLGLLLLIVAPASTLAAGDKGTSGFLEIDGAKLYYEECGSGPNIVLLHDGLLHSVTWDDAWPALCAKFHVVRYDRRGYGRSDAPKARFSPTEDLREIMSRMHMQRAVIVGNSSVGALAIDFALVHPESVDALFLIGPVVHGLGVSDHFDKRGEKNQAPLDKKDFKAAAMNWSRDPYLIANGHDAARKTFYEQLIRYPQNLTYSGAFEIRPEKLAIRHLGEIHVPTFVVVGEFDIPDVHAHGSAIEAGIPWASRNVIPSDGHLIQLEDPNLFVEKLTRVVNLQARSSVKVPPDTLRLYAGRYNTGFTVVTIREHDDELWLETSNAPAVPMFASSETKFFLRTDFLEFEFVRDAAGKIVELVTNDDGRIIKAPRM